jgi:uncharacterized FlaG/YvyC family protein
MLEAVNSVLSNAQYTRAAAEQQSVVNSYAANPERIQQASTQAPYLSLYIKVDTNFDKAILQIRDNESGDVLRQIPTESQLEAYRRAQTSNAIRPREAVEVKDVITTEPKADIPDAPAPQVVASSVEAPKASTPSPAPSVSIDTEV